jgi:hypothetical protein
MDKNAHAENKFGHFVDHAGESVVGAELPRKVVGAVAAGLQIGGSGLLGEWFCVDHVKSGLCKVTAQASADHPAPVVLRLLFARGAWHEVAMLELELENRHPAGGMRSASRDARN